MRPGPRRALSPQVVAGAMERRYVGRAQRQQRFVLIAALQRPRAAPMATQPQAASITNPGALWDESSKFYPRLGGTPHLRMHEWRWTRGGKIKFSHLQFETTVYDWQGAQITLICFDELTHFSAHQFFYMVSRNRSDLRCPALYSRDLQSGRRKLGRRLPFMVDRPGERP